MKLNNINIYLSAIKHETLKLERYIKSNGKVWNYPTKQEMLNYNLCKEEWEAEIDDFIYGIQIYEKRDLDQEELNHLQDMIDCENISWSIYGE